MALAAERPLLVRGEPGTGKSQLARAAAESLGRVFVSEVVHARTEPQDLQWHFDAIARLGEAQRLGASGSGVQETHKQDPLDPSLFLSPGVLWWVFDWHSAEHCYNNSRHQLQKPETADNWQPKKGAVLLIDEIDKADSDLPNSLLETLGNSSFSVPWLDQAIGHSVETPKPLVMITTNEERELPPAFVRRCLVLNLELPTDDEELRQWLMDRGRIHFADQQLYQSAILEQAAQMVLEDRKTAKDLGITPPGQAEYIDLLRAVFAMEPDISKQNDLIKEIGQFALKKHAK
jgi:MoxR-like ATPase